MLYPTIGVRKASFLSDAFPYHVFHLRSKTFQVDPKTRQTGAGILIQAEGPIDWGSKRGPKTIHGIQVTQVVADCRKKIFPRIENLFRWKIFGCSPTVTLGAELLALSSNFLIISSSSFTLDLLYPSNIPFLCGLNKSLNFCTFHIPMQ